MWFENKLQVNIITDNNEEITRFPNESDFSLVHHHHQKQAVEVSKLVWIDLIKSVLASAKLFSFVNNWRSLLTRKFYIHIGCNNELYDDSFFLFLWIKEWKSKMCRSILGIFLVWSFRNFLGCFWMMSLELGFVDQSFVFGSFETWV